MERRPPGTVAALHRRFVDAGADIILTNTFGCNRNRLALHRAEHRVFELAKAAAAIAREVADAADRPVVVAGSVGPTGELFAPLGALTHEAAVAAFREQIDGLRRGRRRRGLDRDDVGARGGARRSHGGDRGRGSRTRRRARSTRPDGR